jgi:hypothetical protein
MSIQAFLIALHAFTKRKPFKPFLIELFSGDRIYIRHPEALALRGDLIYFVGPNYQARLLQTTSVCPFLDLAE